MAKRKTDEDSFGARLRRLRLSVDITQRELAEKIGVTPQAVNKYERNINIPSWPQVVKLAKALGCKTDDFIVEAETETDDV